MINSNRAKAAPRGKPFVQGDARINRDHGPKCADAAAYSINTKNALARRVPPEKLVDILEKFILRGAPWAISLAVELLVEKQPQNVKVTGQVAFIMPRPEVKK
jgi:hypothetical protein